MLKQVSPHLIQPIKRKGLLLTFLASGILLSLNGCHFFQPSGKTTIKTSDGKKIDVTEATVKQYVAEWHESKPSIERLASMENDLAFLLAEVSKMSDLGQTPGVSNVRANPTAQSSPVQVQYQPPIASTTTVISDNANMNTGANAKADTSHQPPLQTTVSVPTSSAFGPSVDATYLNFNNAFCAETFVNNYKKSIAFSSFPRIQVNNSKLGALHQVEQHLPMLIGANLRNRHQMLAPIQLREAFTGASQGGELLVASHTQTLARQHRVQFLVSGEVDDMSMSFPDTVEKPGYYTRFVSGVHNFLHINTSLDKRSRVFSFTLNARDGVTGQLIFSNQYRTFGQWKAVPEEHVGFGSPRFWSTDYGRQIQQLVAKASDELAATLNCQPYMARVDSRPYQQQVIIHSGANNGMRSGDTLDLYQLVYQPINGEYQQFDTRLIKHNGRVHLTEIYPSHSVGHVVNETLTAGQYLVKAQ